MASAMHHSDNVVLEALAKNGSIDFSVWPGLLERILPRLDHIAHNDFPIPSVPLPEPIPPSIQLEHSIKPDASSQESLKENTIPDSPTIPSWRKTSSSPSPKPFSEASIPAPPGALPPQILTLLSTIQSTLKTQFSDAPPHTSQRLAELLLRPGAHYRTLPSYLRALDRVVSVSSPTTAFPLPSATPLNPNAYMNGSITPVGASDSSDDNLGGAALTPIPWLRNSVGNDMASTAERPPGSDLRTESTSLIDGPNGAGSVETVTVASNSNSKNSVLATGQNAVTQGELIRQEQEAGIVPVPTGHATTSTVMAASKQEDEDEEEIIPHARGPEEIGMEDMGPQRGLAGDFDVEAALGRKGEGERPIPKSTTEQEEAENRDEAELHDRYEEEKIEMMDADGNSGGEKSGNTASQNVGPDAVDSTIV